MGGGGGGGGDGDGGGGKSKKAYKCCAKEELRRGAWSAQEDRILMSYVNTHGEGKWRELPQKAGLRRCGKSCRLRWLNYLRPDIKRGNISSDEEDLIIRLHKLLGNRKIRLLDPDAFWAVGELRLHNDGMGPIMGLKYIWSLIAGRLPGRTDNEIKNYWNTNLCRKFQGKITKKQRKRSKNKKLKGISSVETTKLKSDNNPHSIQARSSECNKASSPEREENHIDSNNLVHVSDEENSTRRTYESLDFLVDPDISELCISDFLNLDFLQVHCEEIQVANNATGGDDGRNNNNSSCCLGHPFPTSQIIENCTVDKAKLEDGSTGYDNNNVSVELDSTWEFSRLCSFLGINKDERAESQ